MSAASRTRGHTCERNVARWLREHGWPDACTTRAKLGHDGAHAPGDIDFHPLIVLEVKDVAASAFPTWCRQALAEAPEGTIPVVLRRERGVTRIGEWRCRVPVDNIGEPDMPGATVSAFHDVNGRVWASLRFGGFVAALRRMDEDRCERCRGPLGDVDPHLGEGTDRYHPGCCPDCETS